MTPGTARPTPKGAADVPRHLVSQVQERTSIGTGTLHPLRERELEASPKIPAVDPGPERGPADRVATQERAHIGRCRTCERTWDTFGEAHCAACCSHFTSDSAFDRHLAPPTGAENCFDPATLTKQNGEPMFAITERASGPMWILADERDHHFASSALRHAGKRSESTNTPPDDQEAA
jgi:hypothetical protein